MSAKLWLLNVAATGLLIAAVGAGGCVGEATPVTSACPPFDDAEFEPVSSVLERKCGSLDCHGAPERSFVIFGVNGRRRPGGPGPLITTSVTTGAGGNGGSTGSGAMGGGPPVPNDQRYVTGGRPTTPFEREGTYQSLCALQPEILADVVSGALPPTELTLIRKARLDEKHKGGRIWLPDSAGDQCLQSWARGDIETVACLQTP